MVGKRSAPHHAKDEFKSVDWSKRGEDMQSRHGITEKVANEKDRRLDSEGEQDE